MKWNYRPYNDYISTWCMHGAARCAETPVMELLRIPCAATSFCAREPQNSVFGVSAHGVHQKPWGTVEYRCAGEPQKLHYRNFCAREPQKFRFWSFCVWGVPENLIPFKKQGGVSLRTGLQKLHYLSFCAWEHQKLRFWSFCARSAPENLVPY